MATIQEEIWEILRNLAQSDEALRKQQAETFQQMKETARQMKETDRKLKDVTQAIGRLGNRLGEFVEEMVRPAAVRLFRERGIDVHEVYPRAYAERDGDAMEIDLLIVNGTDAVLVETKSELKLDDVREHLDRMGRFKALFPAYREHRVMGAVAAMVVPDDVARFAYRQGLFVLAQNGDSVTIRNDGAFRPGIW
ncbi:DUF3782 domain-containing protein [Methylomagnum sp.]